MHVVLLGDIEHHILKTLVLVQHPPECNEF